MLTIDVDSEIKLRIREDSDATEFFNVINNNRKYLSQWLSWVDKFTDIDSTRGSISEAIIGYENNKFYRFGISYNNELVGIIELQTLDFKNKKAGIGYWLIEKATGKGIMIRSVKALINYAFSELNFNRISLTVATENYPSIKVCEKLGLVKEGILRQNEWLNDQFVDHYIYSILKSEWIAERIEFK